MIILYTIRLHKYIKLLCFTGCQTGTGAIVRGDQCCQLLFQDQVKLGPDGVCLVGGAEQLAKLSFEPKFPIAPRPFQLPN